MTEESAQICVIDDDASVRAGLVRLLKAAGYRVTACVSADAFLAGLSDLAADCLLLDVRMTGMDGMVLHEHLRAAGNPVPVVFLTGHGDIPMSVRAIKRGAEDFLTKPVDEEVLIGAVEKALETGRRRRRHAREQALVKERLARLSPREMEVMRCLLTGALNKHVADHLGIVEKTVKVHRAHIFEKTETRSLAELARLCALVGIEPCDCMPS